MVKRKDPDSTPRRYPVVRSREIAKLLSIEGYENAFFRFSGPRAIQIALRLKDEEAQVFFQHLAYEKEINRMAS